MICNPKVGAMMAYWNWAGGQRGGVGAEVRLRISYEGIRWGVPVTYEKTGLTPGLHAIRIVCKTPVIDTDYFAYGE